MAIVAVQAYGSDASGGSSVSQVDILIAIAKAEVGYKEKASNSQLDDKYANPAPPGAADTKSNYTKYAR